MPVGVVHTALDDGHFGRKTAEKQWGRRGVGTVVGHLQNRQGTGIRTVRHVLLLVRLGVASEQDAGCAIGQQDGHGVVVDLGEQTAFCVRRRSYNVPWSTADHGCAKEMRHRCGVAEEWRGNRRSMPSKEAQTKGRLRARPVQVTGSAPVGLQPLMLGAARDSYLYVPTTYRADRPAPLVLLLHGAGGHARQGLDLLRSLADAAGLLLLAPASRGHTWDLLVGHRYGPDAAMIDRALE